MHPLNELIIHWLTHEGRAEERQKGRAERQRKGTEAKAGAEVEPVKEGNISLAEQAEEGN